MSSDFFSNPLNIIGAIAGFGVGIFTGGSGWAVAAGALGGLGGLVAVSTIEGIATGRMFSSPMAFLFEPTRAVCELLGITDKTVTQGSFSVVKIFHENQYPDTLVSNCISRNKDGSDLMTYYYNFAKVGQAQFDKYYHTGKKRFIDALPDCTVASATVPFATIEKAIDNELHVTSKIRYLDVGYPDYDDWARYKLQNQGKYNYASNIVTIDNKQYNIAYTDYNENSNKIEVYLTGINGNSHRQTLEIDPAPIHSYLTAIYTTTTNSYPKIWIHKTNVNDLGVNFSEDDIAKMIKVDIKGLPIACLRNDKINLVDVNENSDCSESFKAPKRYKQTKKLLKAIGVDIEEITKEYSKNGSINDVYDTYFMAGLSPKQTMDDSKKDKEGNKFSIEVVAKYMYDCVNFIYKGLPCVVEGQPYFFTFEELPLKGQVVWAGVPPKEITGKKCKHGHYTFEVGDSATNHYKIIIQQLAEYLGSEEVTTSNYDDSGYAYNTRTYTVYKYKANYLSLELANKPITPAKILSQLDNAIPFFPNRTNSSKAKRIGDVYSETTSTSYSSESPSFPEIVTVTEQFEDTLPIYRILKTTTSVETDSEGFSTQTTHYNYEALNDFPQFTGLDIDTYVTVWKEPTSIILIHQHKVNEYIQINLRNIVSIYYTESVSDDLLGSAAADESNFLFPISYYALRNLSVYEKTKLFSESFYMLFFAKKTQHLEFYQTEEFGTFLQIVGVAITIVVSIFTWGSQTMTTQMVIQSLIKAVVIYVGVTLALQVISATIPDSTLKAVLSAAVMVAAIYFGGGFNNFDFSTAVQLADVAVKAVDIYTKDQLKYAQQDMVDLQNRYKEAQQKVEEATGHLTYGIDTQDVLATQAFARSWDGRIMSRDEFYTITLTCPDLYSVCQDQIDRSKSTDLDVLYPLYDM